MEKEQVINLFKQDLLEKLKFINKRTDVNSDPEFYSGVRDKDFIENNEQLCYICYNDSEDYIERLYKSRTSEVYYLVTEEYYDVLNGMLNPGIIKLEELYEIII